MVPRQTIKSRELCLSMIVQYLLEHYWDARWLMVHSTWPENDRFLLTTLPIWYTGGHPSSSSSSRCAHLALNSYNDQQQHHHRLPDCLIDADDANPRSIAGELLLLFLLMPPPNSNPKRLQWKEKKKRDILQRCKLEQCHKSPHWLVKPNCDSW